MTITSAEEQTFIENYMRSESLNGYAWIGAYSDGQKWSWVTEEAFEYTNWESGQPNNDKGEEFFGHLNNMIFGKWNDCHPIEDAMSFICEWEAE